MTKLTEMTIADLKLELFAMDVTRPVNPSPLHELRRDLIIEMIKTHPDNKPIDWVAAAT